MRNAFVAVAMSVAMLSWGSSRVMAVCGDGVVDTGEDCDLGGTCIGGSAAGTACKVGDTTCTGGTCTTFGGQGCAANCTTEHDVPFPLLPGSLNTCAGGSKAGDLCSTDSDCPSSTCAAGLTVAPGTSGVAIDSDFLSIPLPLGPACNGGANAGLTCATAADCPGGTCVIATQTLTIGREVNGTIPVVVKAASVQFPGIPVSTIACGCIHGIASKTCGGTFFEADGQTLSPNCTPGFSTCTTTACNTTGEPCAGLAPCAFVHGAGNTAAGEIGCEGGLANTNLSFSQDSGGASGACAAPVTCPAVVTLSGSASTTAGASGGPGSALVFQTLGITAALGPCTGSDPSTYGKDGIFCTADDPPGGVISVAGTLPVTTGTATAVVNNANGTDGVPLGPVTSSGTAFSCSALESSTDPSAAGGGLVGAFSFVHLDTVGDVAVTAQLFASGTVPPTPTPGPSACTGDCNGDGSVTVNELITMVNIALGNDPVTACPPGDANHDGQITINEIIQAVGYALNTCPAA